MTPQDGGEKTEKATPKKRQDARKKGQVLKSTEVNTAVLTLAMFVAVMAFGGMLAGWMGGFLQRTLGETLWQMEDVTQAALHLAIVDAVIELLRTLAPLLAVALVVGVGINLLQVGFLFVPSSLTPKFSKINPLEGFKRIFSLKSVVELLKTMLKAVIIGVILYQEYMRRFPEFPNMMFLDAMNAAQLIFDMCISVAIKAAVALTVLGLADYLYQWFDFEKNLKMTKEEIKQEYKTTEGDPQIKGRRREKQRQMSMMRMMQSLPNADVVITNPTHYAVALQYDDKVSDAPVVVAKGKDFVAQKLKARAAELGVELVENKPVAQALYVSCEIGDKVPPEMFAAVAEILAYVYKLKNGGTGRQSL